jgi:hypothetical protein
MRPLGSPQKLERRRLRAIKLLMDGHTPVEVARIVGCDRRSVRRWNAAYRNGGVDTLKARGAPGRKPKLDEKARLQLKNVLLKGADLQCLTGDCPSGLSSIGSGSAISTMSAPLCMLDGSKRYTSDPFFIGEDSHKYYPVSVSFGAPVLQKKAILFRLKIPKNQPLPITCT